MTIHQQYTDVSQALRKKKSSSCKVKRSKCVLAYQDQRHACYDISSHFR